MNLRDGAVEIVVRDNGVGRTSYPENDGFGMVLMRSLSERLEVPRLTRDRHDRPNGVPARQRRIAARRRGRRRRRGNAPVAANPLRAVLTISRERLLLECSRCGHAKLIDVALTDDGMLGAAKCDECKTDELRFAHAMRPRPRRPLRRRNRSSPRSRKSAGRARVDLAGRSAPARSGRPWRPRYYDLAGSLSFSVLFNNVQLREPARQAVFGEQLGDLLDRSRTRQIEALPDLAAQLVHGGELILRARFPRRPPSAPSSSRGR